VAPLTKDPAILSVGRFTGGSRSKGQLELVEAFRRLAAPVRAGWTLHLAGYVADVAYLRAVGTAAEGLPVVLHPDVDRVQLEQLYGRASICWHACGLGADAERQPERLEHFGISVVEAMSAGAVPLVLDAGGPAEVVAGVAPTWSDLDDLVAQTERLMAAGPADQLTIERIRQRAESYGPAAFAERVDRLFSDVLPG
jgi:glycosyltransferase involved in cell wall biosynthesis